MILIEDYFGKWECSPDATPERVENAKVLLSKVNPLLNRAFDSGVQLHINPNTKTHVAGNTYGGFRPQDCPQGAPHSSHKDGRAVDVFDPFNELDNWLTDKLLEEFGLYRESPLATKSWCHLTDKAPGSGKRTFTP